MSSSQNAPISSPNLHILDLHGKKIRVMILPDGYNIQIRDSNDQVNLSPILTIKDFAHLILQKRKYYPITNCFETQQEVSELVMKLQGEFPESVTGVEVAKGESPIQNEIDLAWVKQHLPRAFKFLRNEQILSLLAAHLMKHIACSYYTAKGIACTIASLTVPPMRKYADESVDYTLERGQEQCLLRKISGTGAGATLKYLKKVAPRIFPPTNVTKPYLERSKDLLDYSMPVFEELSIIYPRIRIGKVEQVIDSDVASWLRQVTERGESVKTVTERDALGNPVPKTIRSPFRVATIAMSNYDLKEVGAASRYNYYPLPQEVGEVAEIAKKLRDNLDITKDELEERKEKLTSEDLSDEDVKAIYDTLYVLNRGMLSEDEDAKRICRENGVDPNILLPLLKIEVLHPFRLLFFREWLKILARHNLHPSEPYTYYETVEREDDTAESVEKHFTLKDVEDRLKAEASEKDLEWVMTRLYDVGVKVKDEALARLYLDAIRRGRVTASLQQLIRPFNVIEEDEKRGRVLSFNFDDWKEGFEHVLLQGDIKEEGKTTTENVDKVQVKESLRSGRKTAEEIAKYMSEKRGKNISSDAIRPLLLSMCADGELKRTGEGKKGSPYQYELAESTEERLETVGICEKCEDKTPLPGVFIRIRGRQTAFRCWHHSGRMGERAWVPTERRRSE